MVDSNLHVEPSRNVEINRPGVSDRPARKTLSGSIRIGLVDDHHLVRESLRLILDHEVDLVVVGQAATHHEAFTLAESVQPDVILLDLAFPEGDGISLLRALRNRHHELRIIVVTMDRGSETVRQALLAGASGYVPKGAHAHELVEAIRAVARGEQYLHSSITSAIIDDSIRWTRTGNQLSVREREIVGHLAAGHSPAAVGIMLGISVHTVRRHIANLSEKLGIHGRTALTRYAMEHGLIRER